MYNNNRYSLHHLVESDDNVELVRVKLERGTDPNKKDGYGQTLLHAAANSKEDNPRIVQILIIAGADVNRAYRQLYTPLQYAVIGQKCKVVELLLQANIDTNWRNKYGETALHYALKIRPQNKESNLLPPKYLCITRKLLDHRQINVDIPNNLGRTAIVYAIRSNEYEIVKMLLNKNANLNIPDFKMYHTALHVALLFPDPYVIVALLLKKANVLKMCKYGKTPLSIIIKLTSIPLATACLKVIAFNYNLKEVLNGKIQSLELSQLLKRCWNEISRMKSDVIVKDLTVFDFFCKCTTKSGFKNPKLEIYKPVIERLVNGVYREYFCYIFNRLSESTLTGVLEIIVNNKYFNIESDVNSKMKHLTNFLQTFKIGLIVEYLSRMDIFILIVALTSVENGDDMLDFRNQECYLTDLWDQYSDDHFQ